MVKKNPLVIRHAYQFVHLYKSDNSSTYESYSQYYLYCFYCSGVNLNPDNCINLNTQEIPIDKTPWRMSASGYAHYGCLLTPHPDRNVYYLGTSDVDMAAIHG